MIKANWPSILEVGLRDVFFTSFNEMPLKYDQVFTVLDSTKSDEQDLALAGMGIWDENPDGESLQKDNMSEIDKVTYTHATFRRGFDVTRDLIEDDQYNIPLGQASELGSGARTRVDTAAANVFNNAFSGGQTGPDGLQLCADARPLANSGETNDNKLALALTDANVKTAITAQSKILSDAGGKTAIRAKTLLVAPANMWNALAIVNSTLTSGTANNDDNSLKGALNVVVWDYLTDDDAWFLIDPAISKLKFYWRIQPEFTMDSNSNTQVATYQGRMRLSVGWSDYRAVMGCKP
jgi:phage major head subunit gpT-like protein